MKICLLLCATLLIAGCSVPFVTVAEPVMTPTVDPGGQVTCPDCTTLRAAPGSALQQLETACRKGDTDACAAILKFQRQLPQPAPDFYAKLRSPAIDPKSLELRAPINPRAGQIVQCPNATIVFAPAICPP